MAALPRSEISFRRQGSSGLVWDDKLFSGELKQVKTKGDEDDKEATNAGGGRRTTVQRSRSDGRHAYRSIDVVPTVDPPSPKVSGCGLCGVFGKPVTAKHHKKGNRKS